MSLGRYRLLGARQGKRSHFCVGVVAPDLLAVGLGGSETAGLQLAAKLVRQSHPVTSACNVPSQCEWRDVSLQPVLIETAMPRRHHPLIEQGEAASSYMRKSACIA